MPQLLYFWIITPSISVIFSSWLIFKLYFWIKSLKTKLCKRVVNTKSKYHPNFGCFCYCTSWDIIPSKSKLLIFDYSKLKIAKTLNFEQKLLRQIVTIAGSLDASIHVAFSWDINSSVKDIFNWLFNFNYFWITYRYKSLIFWKDLLRSILSLTKNLSALAVAVREIKGKVEI